MKCSRKKEVTKHYAEKRLIQPNVIDKVLRKYIEVIVEMPVMIMIKENINPKSMAQ